ncbi:hypothetical protein GALMADRAFT_79593 [Galerina marginata CBS 339.88]|uniref:BTB domain-containing protein n=1 Tax=Galerina marginata (strain CBS 339.88) TaxID=685588 RepID=A0A067SCB5_GALM3|nr:hypothetical protein GALMADRAFT_79593 [Galerina marginata CBS 339.88]
MSKESPPAKRQRTYECPDEEITRASRFWFDDGNVVLQAENRQYRVHRSMLSRHSNIFRDMFNMPQPCEPAEPSVEGCPLILLTDEAEDLEQVLSIFYDNIRTNDMRELLPYHQLASILRFGKKYEIDYLRDEGLKRLRLEFPTTLELWDNSYNQCLHIMGSPTIYYDVINLAHELSIQSSLPTMYVGLISTSNAKVLLSGRPLGRLSEEKVYLNQEALHSCLIGRDKILTAVQKILKDWVSRTDIIPANGCRSVDRCRSHRLVTILGLSIFNLLPTLDILNPNPPIEPRKICLVCVDSVKQAHSHVRKEIWESLPSYFDLPKWEDLKDFDQ